MTPERIDDPRDQAAQPSAAANPAGASRLQSKRPVRRVAELLSLDDARHAVVSNEKRTDIRRCLPCDSFPAVSRYVSLCLLTARHSPSRASLDTLFPARFAYIPDR